VNVPLSRYRSLLWGSSIGLLNRSLFTYMVVLGIRSVRGGQKRPILQKRPIMKRDISTKESVAIGSGMSLAIVGGESVAVGGGESVDIAANSQYEAERVWASPRDWWRERGYRHQ